MADQRSRDPFAEFDAAYVFGALSAEDRAAYEAHLPTCADCRGAVADIAGLPGLLARVPVDQVERPVADEVPVSLLPRLLESAAAERRHVRTRVGIAALVAAAAIVVALVAALRSEERTDRATGVTPTPTLTVTASVPAVAQTPMRVVADTPVRATAGLQSVAWGTRIEMHCTYPADTSGTAGDPEYRPTYGLRVVPRTGEPVVVTTWNAVPGATVRLEGDTHLLVTEIAAVQLVDAQGEVLLVLDS